MEIFPVNGEWLMVGFNSISYISLTYLKSLTYK